MERQSAAAERSSPSDVSEKGDTNDKFGGERLAELIGDARQEAGDAR